MNIEKEEREELYRKLPEIELIDNDKIRGQVVRAFLDHCPEYFWEVPASSSGKYHQSDVVGKHGLWVHTKRTFTVAKRISDSAVYQGLIDKEERDIYLASILLHDMFKQGVPPRSDHHTKDNHDRICRNYLEENMEIDDRILKCIDSHNGGWGKGEDPKTDLEQFHHLADMVGSDSNLVTKVYKPCEEIKSTFDKDVYHKEGIEADL